MKSFCFRGPYKETSSYIPWTKTMARQKEKKKKKWMFVLNWKALPDPLKQMADELEMKTTTEKKMK